MPPADARLTRDRILATAEDVIRRFSPAKATVVDVARALGVSHAAVYRHVATKPELRDLVVGRWMEATMPPLRAIAALPGPAPQRLRRLFDAGAAGTPAITFGFTARVGVTRDRNEKQPVVWRQSADHARKDRNRRLTSARSSPDTKAAPPRLGHIPG